MIARADRVAKMLRDTAGVDEWVLRHVETVRVTRRLGPDGARLEVEERALSARVWSDGEGGRGAAAVDVVDADEATAAALVTRAAAAAAAGRGPAWVLPPAAAPARVVVSDPTVAADPGGAVDELVAQLSGGAVRALVQPGARVTAEVTRVELETSYGFASEYSATALEVELSIGGDGGARERVHLRERRAADVRLLPALAATAERMALRARAVPLAPGEVDLLLGPTALAADGWFAPFIAAADARRVRLGVSRYRPGQPVFGEGDGAHFSLGSDGTIPFAPRSAPFGELGEPVRRYELIRAGVATGLSLDLREAALAGATPNGGIRNLRLAPGKTSTAELATPTERPLLTLHELAWLDVDEQSGDLAAGISLATRHLPGAAPEPVAGGILLGNLFALWSRARLSAETSAASWYHGPSVRLSSVLVQ